MASSSPLSSIQAYVNRAITELRVAKGISPQQLAAYMNVHRSFVAHIEGANKQHKSYTLTQINAAAYYLGVSLQSLLPEQPLDPALNDKG